MQESGGNQAGARPRTYEFGPFRLDTSAHTLTREGEEVSLAPKLFDILRLLVEADGQTVDKDQFMAAVWADSVVEEGSLTRSISRLRATLGVVGTDETYIKTVARRGYRFVASVREVPPGDKETEAAAPAAPAAVDAPTADVVAAPTGGSPAQLPGRIRLAILVVMALAGAGLVWGFLLHDRPTTPDPGTLRSLAVLPFQGLDDQASGEGLGLGLADSLITRLSNQSRLTVRPTSSVRQFAGPSVDALAAGRALAVDAVLEGTIRRVDDRYRVNVRLIDVASGRPSWGNTFDEPSLNLLVLEDRLAERLASASSLALTSTSRDARGTASPEAYEAYLRGRFLTFKLARESFKQARTYLDRAIALDSGFARAHSALAYLHVNTVDLVAPPREAFTAAKAAVARALALDPRLPDALATSAMIEWQYEWNWAEAERKFKQALDLDPSDPFVRSQYAFFLASMGRAEESITESDRVIALDPLTVDFGATSAMAHLWARRFTEAAERSQRISAVDSQYWVAVAVLGRALEGQGAFDRAIAAHQRALTIDGSRPEALMDLGRAQARAGRRADAERTRSDIEDFGRREYSAPFHLAVVDAALGHTDRAFEELDQAIAARSWYATWLLVDPSLDPLRKDPRFAQRLERVGFTARR
jgi:DNA-binding winged helix-turn-helix (wHTH) protein/TolB-like protein/predicted Zn-dependent protease